MKLQTKMSFMLIIVLIFLFSLFSAVMCYMNFHQQMTDKIQRIQQTQNDYLLLMTENLKDSVSYDFLDEAYYTENVIRTHNLVQKNFQDTTFSLIKFEDDTPKFLAGDDAPDIEDYSELLDQVVSGENTGLYKIESGQNYRILFVSGFKYRKCQYCVASSMNIDGIYENREGFYILYLGSLFAVVIIGFPLIYLTVGKYVGVMGEIENVTGRYAMGDFTSRITVHETGDEIEQLSNGINSMADQLNDYILKLQDALQQREYFTTAFAHELKTPLTSIIGYSWMLKMMKLSDDEISEYADYIHTQGKRLEKLSYQMLGLSGISNADLASEVVQTKDIADEALNVIKEKAEKRKIHISGGIEPRQIIGGRELLITLLVNVLDNAIKASDDGMEISFTGKMNPDGYMFCIMDHGRGIPGEEIDKIMEPFYMVDKSRDRRQGGTGLGLSICKKILELHHGTMQIESEPGIGTKICIHLSKGDMENAE